MTFAIVSLFKLRFNHSMKLLAFLLIFLFCVNSYANEKLSKLNELYLSGILDKSSYVSSLENLGINTSNEIFENLFDLFSDKTLDIETYEKSLNNLINISNNNKSEIIVSKDDTLLKKSKNYTVNDCKGDSKLCKDIVSNSIFNFYFENNEVLLNTKWLDDIVSSDPVITRYMGLKFKRNTKSDDFKVLVDLFHIKGILIKISFKGFFEKEDFFVTRMSIGVGTKQVVDAELIEKLN